MILDAGVLVSVDRNDKAATSFVEFARRTEVQLHTTAPVVSQVWRSDRQVLLARFLRSVRIHDYQASTMRAVGELLARSGTSDVVDAHLVITAHWLRVNIVSGDSADLATLAAALPEHRPIIKSWP